MVFAVTGPGRTAVTTREARVDTGPQREITNPAPEEMHTRPMLVRRDDVHGRGGTTEPAEPTPSRARSRESSTEGRVAARERDLAARARIDSRFQVPTRPGAGRGSDTSPGRGLTPTGTPTPTPSAAAPTPTTPVTPSAPGTGPRVIGPNGDSQPLNPAQLSTPEEAREVLQVLQGLGLQGVGVSEQQLGGPFRYDFGNDPRRIFMIGGMNAGLVRDTLRNNPPHIALERLRLDMQHKPPSYEG